MEKKSSYLDLNTRYIHFIHDLFDEYMETGELSPVLTLWFIVGAIEAETKYNNIQIDVSRKKLKSVSRHVKDFLTTIGISSLIVDGKYIFVTQFDVSLIFPLDSYTEILPCYKL